MAPVILRYLWLAWWHLINTRCFGRPWRLGPGNGLPPTHLVVICHGAQSDSLHMQPFAQEWQRRVPDAAFFLPEAHFSASQSRLRRYAAHFYGRRYWFGLIDRSPEAMEAGIRAPALEVNLAIDKELARLGLPASRVVISGYSQGGMIALFAGVRRPVAPLAIASLSATLLDLPALRSDMQNHAPVLLIRGAEDDVVSDKLWRDTEQALREAGISVETFHDGGTGHLLSSSMRNICLDYVSRIIASIPEPEPEREAALEADSEPCLDAPLAAPSDGFA